jgi:hypothetical protein
MRVFVALFLIWLLAATLCGGRKSWPLACCAPFAILVCWIIWYQIQGWPVTSRPDLGLALFAGVTILGFLSGKLLRKVIFALRVLPAKSNKGDEDWDDVTFQFDIEAPPFGDERRGFDRRLGTAAATLSTTRIKTERSIIPSSWPLGSQGFELRKRRVGGASSA